MTAEPRAEFDAFLSYCREDEERVRPVHAALQRLNLRVWRDTGQIESGDAWIKHIELGLSESNCVVLFNSRRALKSVWVQREWNVALALNKRVVPVRLDESDVPLLLKTIEYVDFQDAGQLEAALERVVRGIRGSAGTLVSPEPEALSNPSVVGHDTKILNRMIQREWNNARKLAVVRWSALAIGLLAFAGLMIWAGVTQKHWIAVLALSPLAISGTIAWVITARLRFSRSTALRLSAIKDGIDLYCPKQGPCVQFRTELEKILKQGAGIQEVRP
jgi:hypothetical protein